MSPASLLWDLGQHGQAASCAWTQEQIIISVFRTWIHTVWLHSLFLPWNTLQWTRTAVHTNSPTLHYCSFVPGKNRVLIPAHGIVIMTDDFHFFTINLPTDATFVIFLYLLFLVIPTCFGLLPAHHQGYLQLLFMCYHLVHVVYFFCAMWYHSISQMGCHTFVLKHPM